MNDTKKFESNIWFKQCWTWIEIREVVNFELAKEIKKDVFHLVTSVEQTKHSESP